MQRWMVRHAAGIACAIACAWALLLVSAPLLATGTAGRPGVALAALAYLCGSVICHQQPGRSFHLASAQLPVCARCTGLYLAGAVGIGVALALRWRHPPPSPADAGAGVTRLAGARRSWRAILILASLPMAASLALEWMGAWAGSNAVRAATGLPAGCAVGAFVVQSLSFRSKL